MNRIYNKFNIFIKKNRISSWQELLTTFFILFISLYVNKNVIDFRIDQIMLLKLFIIMQQNPKRGQHMKHVIGIDL